MTELGVEACDECGFDGRRWRVRDAATLFYALGNWWRQATAGVAAEALNRRPAPGVWSVLEYGAHMSFVTAVIRAGLAVILEEDGVTLPPVTNVDASAGEAAPTLDPTGIAADVAREGAAMFDLTT